MYIFERFLGVLTYTVTLFLICVCLSKSKKRNIGKILLFYILILTTMAYFYIPSNTADLYRLTHIMNYWAQLDFSEFKVIAINSSTPISDLYIYGIGKLKNDHLLPAITAFIYYSNVFYILKKYVYKNKISTYTCSTILFFLMSSGQFLGIISGIRNHLAFSIIAFCIYREMIERKSIILHIPLYIIAALMHNAAFVLVIIRLGYLVFQRYDKSYKKALFILFDIILALVIIRYGLSYWSKVFNKALGFLTSNIYTDIWGYIISTIQFIVIFIILLKIKKTNQYSIMDDGLKGLVGFSKLLTLISIIFCLEYNIYSRFTSVLLIVSTPWMLEYFDYLNNYNKKTYKNARLIIILISICILGFACIQGNLSALKFFII